MDIFIKPVEDYKREINPLSEYKKQLVFYLTKTKSIDTQSATAIIESKLANKEIELKDPELVCFQRAENGDKSTHHTTLINYIRDTIVNKYIIAPTFTNYIPEEIRRSPLVDFIDLNVANRSKAKKEGFKAKIAGDMITFNFKHNEQNNLKTYNNSLSGTFATKGSVLCNPTAHSTLTSVTRMETSLANALNEKLISGNRHYRNPQVTLNNINFLAYIAKKEKIEATIAKYKLVYPTVDDVAKCINASTQLYWIDGNASYKIKKYLSLLQPYELASIMYTSDLYHIRKLNNNFMSVLFSQLIQIIPVHEEIENPLEQLSKIPESIINLAHQICIDIVRGIGKDYTKLDKAKQETLLATCNNIIETLNYYADFFKTFFVTEDIPVSVAHIKSMVRKTVVLSDTDSTMFSSDEWVTWYSGKIVFNNQGLAVAGVVGFLSSQAIGHVLASYSANLGVSQKRIFQIQMKPEYVFPVFIQAPVSKHYFTIKIMQEGIVFKEPDWEIKGVHLKNSALPKDIVEASQDKMKEIIHTILDNKPIPLIKEIKEVMDLETKYKEDILGNREYYFRKTTIKEMTSYKLEEDKCPYWHYKLWNAVFQPKYGTITPPPYKAFILPLSIRNKTGMLNWLASIEDKELSSRLSTFLDCTNKEVIKTINLSEEYVRAFGIPKEILLVLDTKRIILDLTLSRRIIIDSLGYTPKKLLMFSEYLSL